MAIHVNIITLQPLKPNGYQNLIMSHGKFSNCLYCTGKFCYIALLNLRAFFPRCFIAGGFEALVLAYNVSTLRLCLTSTGGGVEGLASRTLRVEALALTGAGFRLERACTRAAAGAGLRVEDEVRRTRGTGCFALTRLLVATAGRTRRQFRALACACVEVVELIWWAGGRARAEAATLCCVEDLWGRALSGMQTLALTGAGVVLLEGLAGDWPADAAAGVGIQHLIGPADARRARTLAP